MAVARDDLGRAARKQGTEASFPRCSPQIIPSDRHFGINLELEYEKGDLAVELLSYHEMAFQQQKFIQFRFLFILCY